MRDTASELFDLLLRAPDEMVYLVLGLLAVFENIFPPVPADLVVLFGGVLAGRGTVNFWAVFLVVWWSNVAGALFIYGLGRRYGPRFFAGSFGQRLLRPRQLQTLGTFYDRYGFGVIFLSRFLPMFRAVVPPFAGVAGVGFFRTAIPLVAASGIWYGAIVYIGFAFGSNWEAILSGFQRSSHWMAAVAAAALLPVLIWWWRSRSDEGGSS
ncbi:DedA family protein [soil metagenome]